MLKSLLIGITFAFIILLAMGGWCIFTLAIMLEKLALWLMGSNKAGPVVNALHANFVRQMHT